MVFDLCTTFLWLIALFVLLLLTGCAVLVLTTEPLPIIRRSESEKYFIDPISGKKQKFPSLYEEWSIHLSVVVPAYNEELRLPPMLDECLEFLSNRKPEFRFEVIVVTDGCNDGTAEVARKYSKEYGSDIVRVLELVTNRGKGGATRLGIQSARGAVILFADADGATKFKDIEKLEENLLDVTGVKYTENPSEASKCLAIVCGSRAHLESEVVATRSIFRVILMHGFHFLVWLFAVKNIRDTQCGFKMLTREAAQACFSSLHVERWAFDVELLYIAQRLKIPISEIAVNWTEIEGSKIVPVWSWLQMGCDLLLIWLKYRIGAWKLAEKRV